MREKQSLAMSAMVNPDLVQRVDEEEVSDWATIDEVTTRNAAQNPATIIARVRAEVDAVRPLGPATNGPG
jgi:hypothetical protein